jgi:hypothetical protein
MSRQPSSASQPRRARDSYASLDRLNLLLWLATLGANRLDRARN